MEGRLVLKDCALLRLDGRVRGAMAVVVEDGLVVRVAPDAEVPVRPGDWGVACRGRLVTPGLVDCHAHGVGGALAPTTGEALLRPARERLLRLAALEALLTPGEVEALTAAATARALLEGVTLRLEHLGCPADVEGGLGAAARTAARLGLRTVLAHATHGLEGARVGPLAQLEANAAFVAAWHTHPLVRGALGFHASHTCDDALLRTLGRLREATGAPALYHLAESADDLVATYDRTGRRVVARLESFGLLGAGCVAAHACGVDRSEAARLAATRTFVALSPGTDALGGAASAGPGLEALLGEGVLLGLGTAGGGGSLWRELDAALEVLVRLARVGRQLDPDGSAAQLLVDAPAELCSMVYGAPSGAVEEGRLADLVVLDDVPMGPKVAAPLALRARARVAWTIVAGRVVVREGELLGADALALFADAARAREAVWARGGGPA